MSKINVFREGYSKFKLFWDQNIRPILRKEPRSRIQSGLEIAKIVDEWNFSSTATTSEHAIHTSKILEFRNIGRDELYFLLPDGFHRTFIYYLNAQGYSEAMNIVAFIAPLDAANYKKIFHAQRDLFKLFHLKVDNWAVVLALLYSAHDELSLNIIRRAIQARRTGDLGSWPNSDVKEICDSVKNNIESFENEEIYQFLSWFLIDMDDSDIIISKIRNEKDFYQANKWPISQGKCSGYSEILIFPFCFQILKKKKNKQKRLTQKNKIKQNNKNKKWKHRKVRKLFNEILIYNTSKF